MAITIAGSQLTFNDGSLYGSTAPVPMLDQNTTPTATSYQIGTYILVAQIQSGIGGSQPPVNQYNTSYGASTYIIPWPTMYFNVSYGGSATYTTVTAVTGFVTWTSSTKTFAPTTQTYSAIAGTWISRGYLGDSEAPNTAYSLYQLFQRVS